MKKAPAALFTALCLLGLATPALAGPPFVCHPFEVGAAKSLPFDSQNWLGVRKDYDISHLVADTVELVTPETPTLVRMETLRRAALYASRDRAVAELLMMTMLTRVKKFDQVGKSNGTELFDAGYVVEALNEIEQHGNHMPEFGDATKVLAGLTQKYDGQAMIQKSVDLRPGDASIEFALYLLSRASERDQHLRKARVGAKQDGLLARNLTKLDIQ